MPEGCVCRLSYLIHRVVSAFAQGVAAQEPQYRFESPAQATVLVNGLGGIFRTGRLEAARRVSERGQEDLVRPDADHQQPAHQGFRSIWARRSSRSTSRCRYVAYTAEGCGKITSRSGRAERSRQRDRSRRLRRLRTTAVPSDLRTTRITGACRP